MSQAIPARFVLEDGAVTAAKLADGAVTNAKIGADAVTAAKVAAGAIELADLASLPFWRGGYTQGVTANAAAMTIVGLYTTIYRSNRWGAAPTAAQVAVPVSGVYLVTASATFPNGMRTMDLAVYRDTGGWVEDTRADASGDADNVIKSTVSKIDFCTAGQYFEIGLAQTHSVGGGGDVTGSLAVICLSPYVAAA